MTDYEKLKKCFDEIGIKYDNWITPKLIAIYLEELNDLIHFVFDDEGKFIEIR